jgi:hypothetical protein
MATNIAEGLQKLLTAEAPERRVRVNILLRSNLAPSESQATIEQIRRLAANAPLDVLERSKTLTATLPLRDVARIAGLPNVFWIDLDREAPLEALLDS